MHKRIQELAKQATSVQRPTAYNPLTFEVFDKEKFAELIVKECAYLNFRSTGVTTDGEIAIGNMILKHFGVKE